MKYSNIPPHVTELDYPMFWKSFQDTFKKSIDEYMDIIPLFHLDYYDGPLSGIIRCSDEYFYAHHIYERERTWWVTYHLSHEERDRVLERNRIFCEHVGNHTNYIQNELEDWVRVVGDTKPQDQWDGFYKNPNLPRGISWEDVKDREIFGVIRNPFMVW